MFFVDALGLSMQTQVMGYTLFGRLVFGISVGLILIAVAVPSFASPIYVYKKGKAITFSSRPPPGGVDSQVFTGRSTGFTTVKAGGFYSKSRFRSRSSAYTSRLYSNASYDQYIKEASTEFGVDKSLIRAVIHAESGFNPYAISPKGAQGLMQLMPGTARMHGVRRSFEPRENIRGGTKYFG